LHLASASGHPNTQCCHATTLWIPTTTICAGWFSLADNNTRVGFASTETDSELTESNEETDSEAARRLPYGSARSAKPPQPSGLASDASSEHSQPQSGWDAEQLGGSASATSARAGIPTFVAI